MTESILSYQQEDPVKLQCKIDLKKLLPEPKERDRFNIKWKDFLESDSCNRDLFDLKGDRLKYKSEQLIPSKPEIRRSELATLPKVRCHDSTM
jgi:hypothetical protein